MSTPLSLYPIPGDSANASVIAVDRAIAELRRGGLVVVAARAGEHPVVAQAAEAATPASLKRLKLLSGKTPTLAVTGRRAAALTLCAAADSPEIVLVSTERGLDAESILGLVHPLETPPASLPLSASPVDPASGEGAAIRLAKLARLLPSAVSVPLPVEDAVAWAGRNNLPLVFADDVFEYDRTAARSLRPVSDARVPLAGAEETRIVAFRPEDGGIEHLAIIIGDPRPDQPVLTRLHSECFTGDLLGSLRCDCGDQLRGAIEEIAATGAGVLLYLAQEGRGIGLVNKLRAYRLQDQGFDTLDANGQLGFDDDERIYLPAAEMLRQLGFGAVRLLTNNPRKVESLARHGITVTERVPHVFPANNHNLSYLRTKATKGGHLF